MTTRFGLLGLGVMGLPMARNIARAGLSLAVFNRSPEKAAALDGEGVEIVPSAAALFEASDVIVLMLKDAAATDAALGREGAAFAVRVADKTVVNMATMAPAYSEGLGAAVGNAGGRYVEAPVSGSLAPAEAGELLVMTAGADEDVARAAPVFEAVGKESVHCGAVPNAMRMKCASNAMLAGVMAGLTESFNFAARAGLDRELFAKVILGGPMACDFLRMKFPRALAGDYAPQASVSNVAYSLGVLAEAAAEAGAPVRNAEGLRALCLDAEKAGYAEEDVLALLKILGARPA